MGRKLLERQSSCGTVRLEIPIRSGHWVLIHKGILDWDTFTNSRWLHIIPRYFSCWCFWYRVYWLARRGESKSGKPDLFCFFSPMSPHTCALCTTARAVLKRPKTGQSICRECFFYVFETEVHNTITSNKLFKPGDRVAIGASGGKDSTVLAYMMKALNERYNYGLNLFLLSIDEGITGYRDDSLEVSQL